MPTQSPTLTPTYDTGAMTMPMEMVAVLPERTVTEDVLNAQVDLPNLNVPFLLGTLSKFLTHERCGTHLYRSVAGRSMNPMLQRKYKEFGSETEEHVRLLEELITAAGGNPHYVSPAARAQEKADAALLESTFLMSGSVDLMTAESVMLDAVFVAESVDHANWKFMSQLVEELPKGDLRDHFARVTAQVEEQEDEHLGWATDMRSRMAMLQTKHSAMARAGMKAEEMAAKVKSLFD